MTHLYLHVCARKWQLRGHKRKANVPIGYVCVHARERKEAGGGGVSTSRISRRTALNNSGVNGVCVCVYVSVRMRECSVSVFVSVSVWGYLSGGGGGGVEGGKHTRSFCS